MMTSCPQHAFGGCPGASCDRQCSERMFKPAMQVVARNSAAGRLELLLICFAVCLSLSAAGYAGGKIISQGVENVRNTITQKEEP